MKEEEKILTPQDVSNYYKTPVGTLANWRWRRVGPKYLKCGRKVFYDKKDVDSFFHSNPVLTIDQY